MTSKWWVCRANTFSIYFWLFISPFKLQTYPQNCVFLLSWKEVWLIKSQSIFAKPYKHLSLVPTHFIFHFSFSACWSPDTHERPSFKHILKTLDDIARSKFQEMPGDNFYSLQDDWKVEIEQMLEEIRFREQVCT